MKNAMQLKAVIKNISKDKHISAQLVMQNYMLERLLERISVSKYHQNFILKGGFLIAAMVGLDTRATMDIDATIKEWPVMKKASKRCFLISVKLMYMMMWFLSLRKLAKYERAMSTRDTVFRYRQIIHQWLFL